MRGSQARRYALWALLPSTVVLATGASVPSLASAEPAAEAKPALNVAAGAASVGAVAPAAPVNPMATPSDAPTITSILPGDRRLIVDFDEPASFGTGTLVAWEYSSDWGTSWTRFDKNQRQFTVSQSADGPLINGVEYTLFVRAITTDGEGKWSLEACGTPMAAPTAPAVDSVQPGDYSAIVNLKPLAPSDPPVDGYQYRIVSPGDKVKDWTDLPGQLGPRLVIPDLAARTDYVIDIRAVNKSGPSDKTEFQVTPGPTGTEFTPLDPQRVFDSRQSGGPFDDSNWRVVNVTKDSQGQTIVPAEATAIAYNITAADTVSRGHLEVQPGNYAGNSATSVLNWAGPGERIANALVAKIAPDGTVRIKSSGGSPNVILDVVGYYVPQGTQGAPSGAVFNSVEPFRAYQVDPSSQSDGLLAPGETRTIGLLKDLQGNLKVPAGATAVAYNLTVTQTTSAGHLRVQPADQNALTPTSALNWAGAGDVVANAAVVKVSPLGEVKVHNGATTPVNFMVDVVGWYEPANQQASNGSLFFPLDPVRLFDSRAALPQQGAMKPGETRSVGVSDARTNTGDVLIPEVVPPWAGAVAYSATAVDPTSRGHLRIFPAGTSVPSASSLNWPKAGSVRANGSAVQTGPIAGKPALSIFNPSGEVEVVVDGFGFFGKTP